MVKIESLKSYIGILNEDEFKIGKEYLYNGLNFWIISNIDGKYSIVDPEYKNNNYINTFS